MAVMDQIFYISIRVLARQEKLLRKKIHEWRLWCGSKEQDYLDLLRTSPWDITPIFQKAGISRQELLEEAARCEPWVTQQLRKHVQNHLRRPSPSYRSSKFANYCGVDVTIRSTTSTTASPPLLRTTSGSSGSSSCI